jgi:hypothetical protein
MIIHRNKMFFIFVGSITLISLISLACGVSTKTPFPTATNPPIVASQAFAVKPDPDPEADPEPSQVIKPSQPVILPSPIPAAKPIALMAKGFGQNDQELGYGFIVDNPNLDLAIENSQYQIAFYNADGTVVDTTDGYINFIPPGQKLGIAGAIYLDEGVTIAKVEVQLKQGDAIATELSYTLTSEKVTYVPSEYNSSARAVITNPNSQDITYLQVSAILYDDAGEIIGGGNTYLNFILANSSVGVIVPVNSKGNVSLVEIFPALSNLYELENGQQLPEGVSKLVILKQGYGQVGTNIGIGMIFENPNQGYAVENSMYHITSYSDDGSILGVSDGYINLLLPAQTLGVADSQYLDEGMLVTRIDIQVKEGNYTESNTVLTFTSENLTFIPDQYSPQVTGEIVNPYDKEITNIRVDAIAYNEAGDIIGSGYTYLDFIPANSKAAVSVYISVAGTPAKVELYAAVSALSDLEN